jgi:hypothetical protein
MIAKKIEKPKEPMPYRDGAGSFEFKEGTGAITAMCPMGEFMELYKVDATAQMRTPESIDPERTNPYAPWSSTVHMRAGSGNPIVARLVVQTHQLLNSVSLPDKLSKDELLLHMHSIKETLLPCEVIGKRISKAVAEIIEQIEANKIPRDNNGRGYNPFPHVPDLVVDANNFLIHANKIIRLISQLPRMFVDMKEDSNFDHLFATLGSVLPTNSQLTKWVEEQAPIARRIVELRNFAEHPKASRKTEIGDFKIMPNGQIAVPRWGFNEDDFRQIDIEMTAIVQYLLRISEEMLLGCLEHFRERKFPMILTRLAEPKSECPVLYRYVPDMRQFPSHSSNTEAAAPSSSNN